MKLLPLTLLALPIAVLACGPFFYPAPPTLERYPERLPVKTMRELLTEVSPGPAGAATFDELDAETRAIAAQLTTASRVELLERIDRALARNRAGDYRKRIANCLYDFRDILSLNGAPAAEVSGYAEWRVNAMEWDDGFFLEPPQESWRYTREEFEVKGRVWEENRRKIATVLEAAAEKAHPVLKPHWLIQNGAWQFKHLRFEDAASFFTQVSTEAPQHPRAEVARLMLARTHMEHWRRVRAEKVKREAPHSEEAATIMQAANDALDAYLVAHPRGRFAPDIPGWRAGLAREQGQIRQAIELFLQQVDMTEHPEIVRRAVRECEACLDELDLEELEENVSAGEAAYALPLAEIARRPIAALAVVYHFLDSESRRNFDELLARVDSLSEHDVTGKYLSPMLRLRRAGRQILPALAEEVAKQKENYGGTVWRPKYLAILAWAASESGEHRQAVRLCDLSGTAMDSSDDLLFVRAVALQRAGELDPAISSFRQLREKFPQSPLNAGTRFRIATALRDKREAGLAVVELLRIQLERFRAERALWNEKPGDAQEPQRAPDLQLDPEIEQWADTLLQFAPLPELERGLQAPDLEPEIGTRLRQILRQRYLAHNEFEAAKRFTEPATVTVPAEEAVNRTPGFQPWTTSFQGTQYPAELTGEEWQRKIEILAQKAREVSQETEPAARAERLFALAEEWSEARGRLTLPSVDDFGLFRNDFYESWSLRTRNARFAGYSADSIVNEFEARDELRHAFRLYLQAAEAVPSGPLAARSLWRANDALRRMAELSPWSSGRAFETNASAISRQLHERLLHEHPDSEEAKRLSVWWSFPPPAEMEWMPGDWRNYNVEVLIAECFRDGATDPHGSSFWEDHSGIQKRFQHVFVNVDKWTPEQLQNELATIRTDFLPMFASPGGAWVINHLDDLALFLAEPGLTPAARAKYVRLRLSDALPNLDDPDLQPWLDYVTFLALVREPTTEDPATGQRHARSMTERMREFLAKFPRSRKREAALARLAIATVRESRVHTGSETTEWPAAPKLGGYKQIAVKRGVPFNAAQVFGALDAYTREYPSGRYAADIRLWRGAAAIDADDWETAVDSLVATLDDQTKRDLHLDAALNLADVFMRLLEEPEKRPEIIEVIRRNPSAQKRLRQFMHSKTLGARLRCLEGYLEEQFASDKGGQ